MKRTYLNIILFVLILFDAASSQAQASHKDNIPCDTIVQHVFRFTDSVINISKDFGTVVSKNPPDKVGTTKSYNPKEVFELLNYTEPNKNFNFSYAADTAIINILKPYFVKGLCNPGNVTSQSYLSFRQRAKYQLDTILKYINIKSHIDSSYIHKKTKNLKDLDGCSFESVPLYFLSPNIAAYKPGENIAKYFTLDTVNYLFKVKKDGEAIAIIYRNSANKIDFLTNSGVDTAFENSFRYCTDTLQQIPFFLNTQISVDGSGFGFLHCAYIKKNKLYTIDYLPGRYNRFENGKLVREIFHKAYVLSSIEWYYINTDISNSFSLGKRLNTLYRDVIYKKRMETVINVSAAMNYRFRVEGMERYRNMLGIADALYLDNLNTHSVGKWRIPVNNYYVRDSLKYLVELYDFNFDNCPDVYYSGYNLEPDSDWSDNVILYNKDSARYIYKFNSRLCPMFLNKFRHMSHKDSAVDGTYADLVADTVQYKDDGISFTISLRNSRKDTLTIDNPLDALTLRLANIDSAYNIVLPDTSRLLTKTVDTFQRKAFIVDSVILSGLRVHDSVWKKRTMFFPPGSICQYHLRINEVLPERSRLLQGPKIKQIVLPKSSYHLLAVLAIIGGEIRDVIGMDPVRIHYQ